MKKTKAILFSGIIIFIGLTIMYCSNLHNIDLIYNAKYIEKLTDDNGIIEQSVEKIYQRSILSLWLLPLLIIFPVWMICYGIIESDKHEQKR